MRIAQVAPLIESVPPKAYGGTERVVSFLTEELVRRGHDVTLFASGDSQTAARLIPACKGGLRLTNSAIDQLAYHLLQIEEVAKRSADRRHKHIVAMFDKLVPESRKARRFGARQCFDQISIGRIKDMDLTLRRGA